MPEDVFVEETPYEEKQAIAREIDIQKRKDDPDFQGAFHEKKKQFPVTAKKTPTKNYKPKKRR